jgi:2-polyprenyl-6-hydroxyphenyl methylase/3-demethylubiquinone-9 3-methyltransferase
MNFFDKNKFNHEEEIEKFEKISDSWWRKDSGPFKILHKINPIRHEFILRNSSKFFDTRNESLKILDIGCGGGILSESLQESFLNSKIIGIDPGAQNIISAKKHSERNERKPEYIHSKFEDFGFSDNGCAEKKFDIICAIEVLEHVEDWQNFLNLVDKALKNDGLFFFSTINRTIKSFLLGIIAAEYILRFVPRGTHSWKKFLKPSEICLYLLKNFNYEIIEMNGIEFNPLKDFWFLSQNLDVNFIACLRKKS